tara:strand:- start:386 stop:676 length:291 start_codon:yes stop_codon:yes gene_type:complete
MDIFKKTPEASLDYSFDWSSWLDTDTSETVTTSVWTVPSELSQPYAATNTGTRTTVWLASGIKGRTYTIKNTITTTNSASTNRSDSRIFKIKVGDR